MNQHILSRIVFSCDSYYLTNFFFVIVHLSYQKFLWTSASLSTKAQAWWKCSVEKENSSLVWIYKSRILIGQVTMGLAKDLSSSSFFFWLFGFWLLASFYLVKEHYEILNIGVVWLPIKFHLYGADGTKFQKAFLPSLDQRIFLIELISESLGVPCVYAKPLISKCV